MAPTPHAVTILRPGGTDAYGNIGMGWDSSAEIQARGFQPVAETLLLPAGTDIRAGDRVRVNGDTYDVEGEPERVRGPSGEKIVVVRLARIPGGSGG